MSFEITKCRLMRKAGVNACTDLLPAPFKLSYDHHSTGHQIDIFIEDECGSRVPAWRASEWFSSSYDFNDRNKKPGVQSGFEWAEVAFNTYFFRLESLVAAREDAQRQKRMQQQDKDGVTRAKAIEKARAEFEGAQS